MLAGWEWDIESAVYGFMSNITMAQRCVGGSNKNKDVSVYVQYIETQKYKIKYMVFKYHNQINC